MAKIKIAQNPTFGAEVQLSQPVEAGFEFRYLDRIALSEMFDRWNKARDAWAEKAKIDLVRTCTGATKAVVDAFQNAYNPARLETEGGGSCLL